MIRAIRRLLGWPEPLSIAAEQRRRREAAAMDEAHLWAEWTPTIARALSEPLASARTRNAK
jgi:hypothetical protein